MRSYLSLLLAASSLCLASSCAGYKVIPLQPNDKVTQGIRYWRPAPYLLVSEGVSDPANTTALAASGVKSPLTYQLIYLPDPTENYAIQYRSGLGSAELSLKLADGWNLTDVNGKTDAKIPETITAVGGLLTAVAGAAAPHSVADATGQAKLGPGLYKIMVTATGITLVRSSLDVK